MAVQRLPIPVTFIGHARPAYAEFGPASPQNGGHDMRLRRINESLGSQNWLAILLDFLIVVVGVFLGLQAQAWNQQRLDRQAEDTYLDRLAADFEAIDRSLAQCMRTFAGSLEAVETLRRAAAQVAAGQEEGLPSRDSLADALIRATASTAAAGRSATFVEMLSAGDLSILRDDTLRNALIAYDQQTQVGQESWRMLRDLEGVHLDPLYRNVDLRTDLDGEPYASIPDFDITGMTSDPDFKLMLNILVGSKANNHDLCKQQRELADTVREAIGRAGRES